MAVVFAYLVFVMLAWSIPVAGVAAAAVLTPSFSVSFMAVARAASRGAPIELPLVLEGFKLGLRPQLALGVVYGICLGVIFAVASLTLNLAPGSREAVGDPQGGAADLGLLLLMYAPVMMMFWFAPTLAAWHTAGVAKALFFSFLAFLMNWRAFLAYGALTAVAIFALTAAVLLLARLVSPELPPASLALPMFVAIFPTLSGSYYASYRDIFGNAA
jgi:hypothetical protein